MVLSVSFSCRISPANIDRDFPWRGSPVAIAVAHFRDVSHLTRKIAGHEIHVVGEIFPRPLPRPVPGPDLRACPQCPLHARERGFTSPANALSWSTMVLMVFFSSRISPFTSTVILRDKSPPREPRVVTSAMLRNLAGKVSGHRVHRVREIFPRAGHTGNGSPDRRAGLRYRLSRAHASYFTGEGIELIDHGVNGFFEQKDFATGRFTVIFLDKLPLAIAVATFPQYYGPGR